MSLTKTDTKNILLTALGGFATFATLAFGNALVRQKLVSKLKIETKYLPHNDDMLMVLLADVENYVYDNIDPVAYIRLVDSCDELIGIKLALQKQKIDSPQLLDKRIDAFIFVDRAKENIERLKIICKKKLSADHCYSCFTSFKRIETQLDYHYDIIHILTKDED